MKKLICTSLLALAVSTANAATYKPGAYLKAAAGVNILGFELDRTLFGTMPAFDLEAGYKFNDTFRAGLDFNYVQTTQKGNKVSMPSLLANLYADFHTSTVFTPYVMGGIGWARPERTQSGIVTKWNALGLSLGLGSKIQLSNNIDLDLSYKFKRISHDSATTYGVPKYFPLHEVTLGLIWNI